jgi:Na+-transporting methylmalonyl-CoA/oxaloacetate decarboxylase gamma subunit
MDNQTFGFTLLVVGMGGTLLTLFFVTLIIRALSWIFPARDRTDEGEKRP